jgi:hypothetical protein
MTATEPQPGATLPPPAAETAPVSAEARSARLLSIDRELAALKRAPTPVVVLGIAGGVAALAPLPFLALPFVVGIGVGVLAGPLGLIVGPLLAVAASLNLVPGWAWVVAAAGAIVGLGSLITGVAIVASRADERRSLEHEKNALQEATRWRADALPDVAPMTTVAQFQGRGAGASFHEGDAPACIGALQQNGTWVTHFRCDGSPPSSS